MKKHLAILSKEAVDQIFEGRKTIETRFSQKRIAPYGQISIGDLVYIKSSGKDIVWQFIVKKVISFEGLSKDDWKIIKGEFGEQLSLGSQELGGEYFDSKKSAIFATIIFIDQLEKFITSPIKIEKKDQRGWVVL